MKLEYHEGQAVLYL